MYISGMQSIRYFNLNNLYVNLKVHNFPVYISGLENKILFNFFVFISYLFYIRLKVDGIYLYAYTRVFVQILETHHFCEYQLVQHTFDVQPSIDVPLTIKIYLTIIYQ